MKFLSQMPLKVNLSPSLVLGTPAALIKMQIPGLLPPRPSEPEPLKVEPRNRHLYQVLSVA